VAHSLNRRAIRWLRCELPELVAGGIISQENAAAIDRHYQAAESRAPNFGFVILAVIGSAMVGAGAILLIAHNWDELSRPTRCLLAFLPLVAALALGCFVLWRRNDSPAWRESVAILDVAAVGTAIALVSQTYQIQGSFTDFMKIWLLLSIPMVYLFRANFAALAYLIGSAVWVVSKGGWPSDRPGEMFFWVLLLLFLPFYAGVIRQSRTGWTFRVLSLALVAAGAFGLTVTVDFTNCDVGGVAFAGFFATVYLAGMMWQDEGGESLNVLSVLGGIGIAATAVVLSFEETWHLRAASAWSGLSAEQGLAVAISLLFPAVAIGLAAWGFARGKVFYSLSAACIPIIAALARFIAGLAPELDRSSDNRCAFVAAVLFNLYAFVLGIELLARGIRAGSVSRANFGLLVIAALALARFFDSDLSFVARGIGFIAVGAGFLIANLIFFRQRTRS
jgi:uncharacterized membrane protein